MVEIVTREPVSEETINALKRIIVASPDAADICKQAMLWLIDQTERLSKSVLAMGLNLPQDREDLESIVRGIVDMNDSSGSTFLPARMLRIGVEGLWASASDSHTYLIDYDTEGLIKWDENHNRIEIDLGEIDNIDLDPWREGIQMITCPDCNGIGTHTGDPAFNPSGTPLPCRKCKGRKQIPVPQT